MKKAKRSLTLLLAAVLCLGLLFPLAGCQKKETPDTPGNSASPAGNQTPDPGSAEPAADTYVYAAKLLPVDSEQQNGFSPLACVDDRLLVSCYEKIGENNPEGLVPEYEGQYDVYGMKLYWLDLDGTLTALENYESTRVGEDGSASISAVRPGKDGTLLVLEQYYRSWYDGPDDVEMYSDEWYQKEYYQYMQYEENYYLRTLQADGAELGRIDLSAAREAVESEGGYFSPQGFAADDQGRVFLNGGQYIYVLDGEGAIQGRLESNNWFESVVALKDGRIGAVYYDEQKGEALAIVDTAALTMDTENSYPITNAWNMTTGGGDYDLYYTNGSNLMGYSLASGKAGKVFNWINVDVDPSDLNNAYVLSDGRVVTVQTEWNEKTGKTSTSLVLVSKVPASSVERKTTLTLATMYLDWNVRRMLVQFNRTNPDYRIELLDYSEYNTQEDYGAGLTKLNTEIMSGRVPDILNLSGMSVGKLAAKGILEDLTPYLNADPELKGQIFDNVLRALQTNGKLYRTASSFNVNTVMGASSVVGDKPGWTLEQYNAALKSMPAGCEPFSQGMTRDAILDWGLALEMNRLVDWSTGKCAFDTPAFTNILQMAAQFPKDYDYENMEWEDDPSRISAGKQMLMQTWISDFESVQMYEAMFGGEATFIGFPTSEGVGNMLQFNDEGYAISAKCAHKDAAWQFLRTMFTAEYQQENTWSIPTNKVAFEKNLEAAMTPEYQKDENGNFILDENGQKIEVSRGSWGWGSIEIEIKALTQEQAAKIRQLIETTDRWANYDEELTEMIRSECEAFFAGQKSAEEVGRLLQSKMTIYVNEQR